MNGPILPSHESSIPLIARLDHLEFIMKYLERKQRCGNNVSAVKDKRISDLAMKEDFYKGTLLDRVASLEHRLFQLCMEVDSSGSSHPMSCASTQTSGDSSSTQSSKGEISYSFPTFNNLPNNGDTGSMPHNPPNTPRFQEKSESVHPTKKSCPPKQQVVKNNKAKKNEKKCKVEKKRVSPVSWPHLKLLGC